MLKLQFYYSIQGYNCNEKTSTDSDMPVPWRLCTSGFECTWSSYFFQLTKRVYSGIHTRFTVPIGPFLCLAMMISATFGFSVSFIIVVIAIYKHHDIGILFNGSRLTEI